MSATSTNNTVRRTLASQLDRLDGILDALSEGLNGAVADAVREATGTAVEQAVEKALLSVLTNPDVNALLGGVIRPPQSTPSPASLPEDNPAGQRGHLPAGHQVGRQVRSAGAACSSIGSKLKAGLVGLWRLRTRLLAAITVGAGVGVGAYFAGPWVSALVAGTVACAVNLFGRARAWLQRTCLGFLFATASP